MSFFFSDGSMLYTSRHYNELSFLKPHLLGPELYSQPSFDDEEHLVFVFVIVPNELAFQFSQFHQLAVDFSNDVWFPVFLELS